MSDPFLSAEDYAEQAHQLYNEGRLDEAIRLLKTGLSAYPFAAELHVGLAYAHLAGEESTMHRILRFQQPRTPQPRSTYDGATLGRSTLC